MSRISFNAIQHFLEDGQFSIGDISKKLGVSYKCVSNYVYRYGYKNRVRKEERGRPHKYILERPDFFRSWSKSMSYCLGFIVADGNIHGTRLTIAVQPRDEDVLHFIRSSIGSNHPIRWYSYVDDDGVRRRYRWLAITSKQITRDLVSLGIIPNKSEIWKTSAPRFYIPEEYKWDFIRGVFDGDGTVGDKRKYGSRLSTSIGSSGVGLLEYIRSLSGLSPYPKSSPSRPDYYTLTWCKKDTANFFKNSYDNECFSLMRKKNAILAKLEHHL